MCAHKKHYRFFLIFLLLVGTQQAKSQCKVTDEMRANGTIMKSTASSLIYSNAQQEVFSEVEYDGSDYFVVFIVKPYTKNEKKTTSMKITLDNNQSLSLDFYDSFKRDKDTSINALFRIPEAEFKLLVQSPIQTIEVQYTDEVKKYILVTHKEQVMEQLKCMQAALKKEN